MGKRAEVLTDEAAIHAPIIVPHAQQKNDAKVRQYEMVRVK